MQERIADFLIKSWPYALLMLFSCVIFAPVLFGDMVFFGEEQIGFYYAISHYVHQSIASGDAMIWIANYYGGVPASLDQFVGAWYPLNRALFALFDTFTAHHLSIVIATAAGLIGSFIFGRAQGWLVSSSLALAFMYYLATTYTWILIGTTTAHSFAILPFLLLALHMAATKRRYVAAILIGGIALAIGFLAGFMQIVFYDYVVAGLYALFLDWNAYSRAIPVLKNLKISFTYAGITLVGLAGGFMQFFPSASLIDLTIRTSSYATQHAYTPFPTEFLAFFLPPYIYIPFFSGGHSAGFYIGSLGLMCAGFALYYYRNATVTFFAGVYAMILAFAFHLPVFGWINEHLPPFSHMGGNFRWITVAAFPIAFIGAVGIEGFLRNPERIPRSILKWVIIIALAICGTLIATSLIVGTVAQHITNSPALLQNLLDWYTNGRTLSFPNDHYIRILTTEITDIASVFSLTNARYLFGTILWAFGAAILALAYVRWTRYQPALFAGFMLITALGTTFLQFDELVPRSLYAEPELAQVIKSHADTDSDYRIMGYIVGDGSFLKLTSERKFSLEEMTSIQMQTLANNAHIYFGFDRMDGMEPYRTLRHNHLLDTVIAYGPATYVFDDDSPALATSPLDQLYNRDVQKKVSVEEKVKDLPKRLPLLSMMNVKYIYSPFELFDTTLREFAQIPITAGTNSYPMYVYENTRVMPRIYVARNVIFASNEREALLGVVREKDFSERTWIECVECPDANGMAKINVLKYAPGSIEVSVSADKDAWLVVSESAFPGWRATVDGNETPIFTANYLFQAIRIPRGTRMVVFSYEDIAIQKIRSFWNGIK